MIRQALPNKRLFGSLLFVVLAYLCGCQPETLDKTPNRQLLQLGSGGTDTGKFLEPRFIQLLSSGNLLVTDFRNYRIQEITTSGEYVKDFGTKGQSGGEFNDPVAAVMDSDGSIYVVDTWNHRIQKRDSAGQWNEAWASGADYYAPRGIAIDDANNVYVSNTSYHNIKVFDSEGSLIATWGKKGVLEDEFHDPVGIAFGPDKKIYVADTGNRRIKVISTKGKTLRIIKVPELEEGKFHESYLAVDGNGKIYVTLPHLNLVQVYNSDGSLFSRFGVAGSGPEQLNYPTGIAVDSNGQIYISDSLNNRIVKYAPAPPMVISVEAKPTLLDSVIDIGRGVIDVVALIVIFGWIASKLKQRKTTQQEHLAPEPRQISFWNRLIENLKTYKRLNAAILIIAILLAIGAVSAFMQYQKTTGSLLAIGSILLFLFAELPMDYESTLMKDLTIRSRYVYFLLVILVIYTVFVRVYKLDSIPWGINNDAAWNGIYAQRILSGEFNPEIGSQSICIGLARSWYEEPFTPEAWGKETFYMYLVAAAFKAFGISRFTILIPAQIASALTPIILFFLLRDLFGVCFAFVGSFIYSSMAWTITFSRVGYRAALAPLFMLLTIWMFYRAVDSSNWKKRFIFYLFAGISIGIGLNTYFSFRGAPFLLIFVGIIEWFRIPRYFRRNWWGFLLLIGSGFLIFTPLLIWALNDWHSFLGRSNFLFVGKKIESSGSLAPLWSNIADNLLIFHYKAPVGNFFNNGWPILSRAMGFFVLLGISVILRNVRYRSAFFTLMILLFGHLPAFLSEPDAARSLMITIGIAILAAIGIFLILRLPFIRNLRKVKCAVLIAGCLCVMMSELHYYYFKLAGDYYAQFGFAPLHTQLGQTALELSKENQIYISQAHFIDTPKFLCYGLPGDVFKITNGEVIDVVARDVLNKNLESVLEKPVPENKGLAFIFESVPLNKPLFQLVKTRYPNGIYKAYHDKRLGDGPIYYSYMVDKSILKAEDP